jgi:hypothetical protein
VNLLASKDMPKVDNTNHTNNHPKSDKQFIANVNSTNPSKIMVGEHIWYKEATGNVEH